MIKRFWPIIIFALIIIIAVPCSYSRIRYKVLSYLGSTSYTIRPVTVRILDGKTGEPLEGITAYYGIGSRYISYFEFFLPSPDPWRVERTEEVRGTLGTLLTS